MILDNRSSDYPHLNLKNPSDSCVNTYNFQFTDIGLHSRHIQIIGNKLYYILTQTKSTLVVEIVIIPNKCKKYSSMHSLHTLQPFKINSK